MKYANIYKIIGIPIDENRYSFNVGDYMQNFAIDNLYKNMCIPEKEIKYIHINDVTDYVGEHLILPIASMIGKMVDSPFIAEDGNFNISDYIIPIFLSITVYREGFLFSDYNINYLKEYGPIGCRDWNTYCMMRKHNIPAYLSGCITLTFDERKEERRKKIYFIDAPEFIRDYVPEKYFSEAIYKHHIVEMSCVQNADFSYNWNYSKNLLEEYKNNAKLVITSRLHAACPCMGLGIPTIIVREYKGYTFDWLNQFTKIYLRNDVTEIDWFPSKPSFARAKELIINTAINRIRGVVEKHYTDKLTDVYTNWIGRDLNYSDSQKLPIDRLKEGLKERWGKNPKGKYKYSIWGVTETAEEIYTYISTNYPNANLSYVIDTFRVLTFHGLDTVKPDHIKKSDGSVVIVASINAINAAWECFKRIKKNRTEYILMTDVFMDSEKEGEI